ncbi:MAG: ABC transporter ATP-binding protein [Cellulosilyticaceae bacterium]
MEQHIQRQRIKKFLSYYIPHKKIFAVDMFFAAVSAIAMLIFPMLSGYLTRTVLVEWDESTKQRLIWIGLGMLVLLIVRMISNIIYAYFGHAMGAKMEGSMRSELFRHYEDLSFAFHSQESVGKLMTIISNDLTSMTELFHHAPEDILMAVIKFVGAFIILITIDVPLTLIVFLVFPFLCLFAIKTDRLMEKGLTKAKSALSEMNSSLEDALSGIRTVKAFGNEEVEYNKFQKRNLRYVDDRCYFYKVEALFYETTEAYPQLLTMLVVFFGAIFVGEGQIDVPILVTFLLYVNCLYEPVKTMVNFMKLYEEGKVSFKRYMDMIECSPEIQEVAETVDLKRMKGEITFKDVTFGYSNSSENVIDQLSFRIKSGESVALVGASGIGKTTIGSLIGRFYDVTAGKIMLDGEEIKEIALACLRKNIGIVQQEVFIFNGTIRENIAYGKPEATDDEIIEAARLANAHEFIEKLEKGYESQVGTRGITLSGGQRQRISLARVFFKNPSILILDEATSALDYESEVLVQESIEKLMTNRTAIIIAHRLSTIKNVDRILLFSEKQIAEEGTHDQLIDKNGEYAQLYSMGSL